MQLTGTNRPRTYHKNATRPLCGSEGSGTHCTCPQPRAGAHRNLHRVTAVIARGKRPVPFRTRKLSLCAPMVLHPPGCGRVGRRRNNIPKRGSPREIVGGPLFGVPAPRLPFLRDQRAACCSGSGAGALRWPPTIRPSVVGQSTQDGLNHHVDRVRRIHPKAVCVPGRTTVGPKARLFGGRSHDLVRSPPFFVTEGGRRRATPPRRHRSKAERRRVRRLARRPRRLAGARRSRDDDEHATTVPGPVFVHSMTTVARRCRSPGAYRTGQQRG